MTEDTALKAYIHSVETSGTVDGPGVRYVIFFSGCPLRCQYCHNPDMFKMKDGKLKTVDEVFDDIMKYASFLKRAKGGVTLSGGEPLGQAEFAAALVKKCKAAGIHTALDTSGYLGDKASDEFLEDLDLVLLDIKSGLKETYKRTTNVELQNTLIFAKRLSDMGKDVWARFVLVPDLTDATENIEAVAEIAKSIKSLKRLDILPFHKMGEYKWKELGLKYELEATEHPTEEQIEKAREIFLKHGIEAR